MLRLTLLLAVSTVGLAQGPFPQPKTFPPDAATLKKITDKTEQLRKAIDATPEKHSAHLPDVKVFHKAAEWIVRHSEWYTEKSAQQTSDVLDAGLKRAAELKDGKTPWLKVEGKAVPRGQYSEVDGSIQPYSLMLPANFDPTKSYRVDVVLHGRDATLTEVKFLHAKEFAKAGKSLDHFVLEVYGRGNNAYRWAGQTDVIEKLMPIVGHAHDPNLPEPRHFNRVFLRGFSMGGAGTWHIGLRQPTQFTAISPGAGFTTTRGYVGNLPKQLPDYVEKCLHIYDAVDYAENVFNVPVIAYSGEKDPQKAAADNIEKALKDFKEPHTFKHLVAPGLEHKQPAEWLKKIDDEFRKLDGKKPKLQERVRYVTYTVKDAWAGWVHVDGLDKHYERSVVDATWTAKTLTATTVNIRAVRFIDYTESRTVPKTITIDGQVVAVHAQDESAPTAVELEKTDGKWSVAKKKVNRPLSKSRGLQGPIDDAFTSHFYAVDPTGKPWHDGVGAFTTARREQFAALWDKWFRGVLRTNTANHAQKYGGNVILFGDPQSNPMIAEVLPKLPIKWTQDELVVNGVKYDPKTHVPVLIYPNPKGSGYVVINSGHTFGEADLRGTNALLYPRLGDWAVLKPTPTKENPAAFEVVAAGLFDEFWQFPKK